MNTSILEIREILEFLQDYTALTCFFSAFFGGTSITILLATISGQGVIGLWKVITFCFLGNFLSDILWFLGGRTKFIARITDSRFISRAYRKVGKVIDKYKDKELAVFIVVKFVYGIRILTIILFGRKRYDFNKFLAYNTTAVLILNVVVGVTGWMAGRGFGFFINIFENIRIGITFLLCLYVLIHILKKILARFFIKTD